MLGLKLNHVSNWGPMSRKQSKISYLTIAPHWMGYHHVNRYRSDEIFIHNVIEPHSYFVDRYRFKLCRVTQCLHIRKDLAHRSITSKFITATAPSCIDNIIYVHDRTVGVKNLGMMLLWFGHCLRLGHETMVCAACLAMFLWWNSTEMYHSSYHINRCEWSNVPTHICAAGPQLVNQLWLYTSVL